MKTPNPWCRLVSATTFLSLGLTFGAGAQTVAPGTDEAAGPVSSAPAGEEESEEVIELSPFTVTAAENDGYRATTTLAGTRIKTQLKDVGSAISVVTEEFMRDTGARNNEDLLVYTTNTEVGGLGGNFTGNGTGTGYVNTDLQRLRPQNNTRVRGLTAADNTRDFFLSDIPWDGYIVGRVDMQRGPNSILFGLGSPAGIVNSTLNTAMFQNAGTIEFRFDKFGSRRVSLDFNRELIADELALRLAVLSDHAKYQQEPAFNTDERIYGALRWDPAFLNSGNARTSLRINIERGDIDANRPRITPPVDAITPWFYTGNDPITGRPNLDQLTFDATTVNVVPPDTSDPRIGAINTGSPTYQPWIDGPAGRIYDGPVAVFPDPAGPEQSYWFMGERSTDTWAPNSGKPPAGSTYFVYRGIQPYNVYAVRANLPGNQYGVYNPVSLTDTSIFNFYKKLIDGPNKREWQKWNAANINLSQTFLDNRAGFELVYDRQSYSDGQEMNIDRNNGQVLTVDIMSVLPDGTANPNVGRPMIASNSSNNTRRHTLRENIRLTAFAELQAADLFGSETAVSKFLGLHRFTGLYSAEDYFQDGRTWINYAGADDFESRSGKSINEASRAVTLINYLGPSLLNADSASGANLSPLTAVHSPSSGDIRLWHLPTEDGEVAHWVTAPISIWNAANGDRSNLYTVGGASLQLDKVESVAFVWQGFLADGLLVPTVGWRHDAARAYVSGNPPNLGSGRGDVFSADWRLPDDAEDAEADGFGGRRYNRVTGDSLSWSIVAHMPRSMQERMPLGLNLSAFFSKSDNFRPDAARRDILGNPVDPATGETKEYGIVLTALEDRLTFKVNRFDTRVSGVTLSADELPNFYLIGAGESWGYGYATWARKGVGDYTTNFNRRTDGTFIVDTLPIVNGEPWLSYQPLGAGSVDTYTPAVVQATYDAQMAAINAFTAPANRPPENFMLNWGMRDYPDSNYWGDNAGQGGPGQNNWSQATGVVVTGDTHSRGWEFELIAQPTKSWSLSVNASKTDATRSNLAQSYQQWIQARWELYSGPAGDVRLWGAGASNETVRRKFQNEVMGNYLLFTQLADGSQAPEIRPWRLNIVTNYSFADGALKGFNAGGSYRWQDSQVIGYPLILGDGEDTTTFDIDNPIMGESDGKIDLWVGYQRKLGEKLDWRIQLNVRNVFGSNELVPITVNADPIAQAGDPVTWTPATMRIEEGMSWTVTNTFKF